MEVEIYTSKENLGRSAARDGGEWIRRALHKKDRSHIILATGASQFEMLNGLIREEIDWSRVVAFHLDEYIDLPAEHPASFRRYLIERFVQRLPHPLAGFHPIDGETEPGRECDRLSRLISRVTVDVAFVGIGENGHLAFNDPPADFDTEASYIVVDLDETCRRQQLGEGWFARLDEVPKRAISMSIRQIMKSEAIVCAVPDKRKAHSVRLAIDGPVTPEVPASILKDHPMCRVYLDTASASLLKRTRGT
jgi:glucosamine-6-phosphate deaminase